MYLSLFKEIKNYLKSTYFYKKKSNNDNETYKHDLQYIIQSSIPAVQLNFVRFNLIPQYRKKLEAWDK